MRDSDQFDTVIRAIKAADPIDYLVIPVEQKDRKYVSVFLRNGTGKALMDNLQTCLDGQDDWRISLIPIEATAPKIEFDEDKKQVSKQALREEIFSDVQDGAKLDRDFLILVVL